MGPGDTDTEIEVAVLDERVKNLCGKVEGIFKKCDGHGRVTKELNDRSIRLESETHATKEAIDFLNDEIETVKHLEGNSEKGIEVKFLYEVIRLLGMVILILLSDYVKKGM